MKYKYVEWHNNYPFKLGKVYEGYRYNDEWLYIDGRLFRVGCFKEVKDGN